MFTGSGLCQGDLLFVTAAYRGVVGVVVLYYLNIRLFISVQGMLPDLDTFSIPQYHCTFPSIQVTDYPFMPRILARSQYCSKTYISFDNAPLIAGSSKTLSG
jgi:hypothetical protein